MTEKICGTCKWHQYEKLTYGWFCVCDKSEYCADWTDYSDSCEEWEDRKLKLARG